MGPLASKCECRQCDVTAEGVDGGEAVGVGEASQELNPVCEGDAPMSRRITVTIVGATRLRARGWVPGPERPHCICTMKSGDAELYCTEAIKGAVEPRWQETFTIVGLDTEDEFLFEVMDVENPSPKPNERGDTDVLLSATLTRMQVSDGGFVGDLTLKQLEDGPMPSLRLKVRLGDQDYPQPPSMETTFQVSRKPEDTCLGIDLHLGDGRTARVTKVMEGPFLPTRLPQGVLLEPGDFIVSVDGHEGNADELVKKMTEPKKTSFEVKVRKPVEFDALMDVRKVGDKDIGHGLNLPNRMVHNSLVVKGIRNGAFHDWNAANPLQVPVKAGDRLVAINGERGTAAEINTALVDAVRNAGVYQCTFVRPAGPLDTPWLY